MIKPVIPDAANIIHFLDISDCIVGANINIKIIIAIINAMSKYFPIIILENVIVFAPKQTKKIMLIISIRGKYSVLISPDLLVHLDDLIQAKILVPIKSFSQYLTSGTKHGEAVENYDLVEKYYGTDIAKSISSIRLLEHYTDIATFFAKIIHILEDEFDCKLVLDQGKKVYLYDINTEKIISTYENYSISNYQTKLSKNTYSSRIGNIALIESPDSNFQHFFKTRFSFFSDRKSSQL